MSNTVHGIRYKGYIIQPKYHVGTDFKIRQDGRVVDRKPQKIDISYYSVIDPMDNFRQAWGDTTIAEAKQSIDDLLKKLNMKSNLAKEWRKLDGYDETQPHSMS